ncbi:CHAP domain-containing protein [Nonomuraea sp. NPDC050202]|uniref:CHAP domain-containing protein n=1 Tax=Nonomuraea sp. NPDC050202 TaxID=3155035 RepID=UPI0033DF2CA1
MTPEMQKYIELLESQLGYSEKSGSYTKFGDWYGKNVEFDADYSSAPWCDMYLSWAAHKLGYEEWIGQFAWTVAHAKWFKEQGAWGKTPKPGAFVFYDWSGSNDIDNIDHIGIVTRVEGNTIHTIEGNIDGGVAKRKERDTSKVVGYGYPERVKERLDEAAAKKKAKEQAAEVGTIQIPEEALSSLIPRAEAGRSAQAPLDSGRLQSQDPTREQTPSKGQVEGQTPAEAQGRTQDQPRNETSRSTPDGRSDSASAPAATTAPRSGSHQTSTQQGPQAGASSAPGTVKKGKHAKPATAGTEAATAEPLPSHADTSATGPLPAIDSPTLIGSALVAALALLAVAKTRRLRLSPATATAGKPARPSRAKGRRRRRGPAPVTAAAEATTAQRLDAAERLTAVELQENADRLATSAALRSLSASDAASDVLSSVTASDIRHRATSRAGSRDAVRSGGARHRKLSLDTRPFDLATDAPHHHHAAGHPKRRHDSGHHRRTTGAAPFTPAFDNEPYEPDFDQSSFAFTEHTAPLERITFTDETGPLQRITFTDETGPLERIAFTDETGPLQRITLPEATGSVEVVLDTGPLRRFVDTSPFERIVIPGATSTFDAFSPPRRRRGDVLDSPGLSYRGRRRRGAGAEEHPAFPADLPLRGRRHRRTHGKDEQQLVGGGRHRA